MIDTQDETLTPDPPASPGTVRAPAGWSRRLALVPAVLSLLLPAAVAVASQLPAQLVAEVDVPVDPAEPAVTRSVEAPFARVPASALPVGDRVSFGGLEGVAELDEDRTGDFVFVTISEPQQSVLSHWAGSELGDAILPLTHEQKYGTATPAQRQEISLQMMRTSEQVAEFVAVRAVGYDARLVPGDVVVGELVCLEFDDTGCIRQAPSAQVLQVGDRIVTADGEEVGTVDDLGAALESHEPGDIVELEIVRRDSPAPIVESVELIAAPDGSGRTIVGFVPFDTATVELPFEVDIDTGEIGGPSAGLAFTLTLIDALSEGDLTGGMEIAVTGEIGLEGEVGAIGGLPQKVAAVEQVGVDHFLVPASQSEEILAQARAVAGDDVEIIPVATLDEALAALERLGGDPVVPVDG